MLVIINLINQDIIENHLFFNDDNNKLLDIAFELKGIVLFFTSPSTLQRIGENDSFWNIGQSERLRNIYNNKLKEFHELPMYSHDDIQNNLDKIKFTIYFKDSLNDGSDFEQKLNESLKLEELV